MDCGRRAPGAREVGWSRWLKISSLSLAVWPSLLLAQEDGWTPTRLVDQSPFLTPVNAQVPAVPGTETEDPAPSVPDFGADSPDSLLNEFNQTAALPSIDQVPSSFEAPVTSLTLNESTVGKTPAAVFVINQEMIRRSGAQTLPEVLRMVPGVHVGVGNLGTPNVSIRGLGAGSNLPFSSRVLVLIDGRSIYEPLLGGVVWNQNDLPLQDIDRIEVIRGPGATIWGANAVNGVINVITKSAEDTQGTLLSSLGGSELHNITVARQGTKVGDDAYLRVYGKFRDMDDQFRSPQDSAFSRAFRGEPSNDAFHDFQAGFRYDNQIDASDKLTVQGRIIAAPQGDANYSAGPDPLLLSPNPTGYFAGSVQSRYSHLFDDDSELTLLAIYDRTDTSGSFGEYNRDSYILDGAYRWQPHERHKLVAGGQFRFDRDAFPGLVYPDVVIGFNPAMRSYNVVSWLIQDEITLIPDDLTLLVGTKMEVNPFTEFEIQPSARLLKTIDDQRVVWLAASRAIRRPSRIDENVQIDGQYTGPRGANVHVIGSAELAADSLIALETGYRAQPVEWFSWDLATFYNIYQDLPKYGTIYAGNQAYFYPVNEIDAQSYGVELSGTVEMTESWKVTGAYSCINVFASGQIDQSGPSTRIFEDLYEGSSPNNILYIRHSFSPGDDWDIDVTNRYVDVVQFGSIPPYLEMDLRLAWRPRQRLELAVVGQNLLDAAHGEFGSQELTALSPLRTQVQRGVYGSITYQY